MMLNTNEEIVVGSIVRTCHPKKRQELSAETATVVLLSHDDYPEIPPSAIIQWNSTGAKQFAYLSNLVPAK